jgi:hypothetical protein
MLEVNMLAGQIVECNFKFLHILGAVPIEIREHFRKIFVKRIKERVEDSVFQNKIKVDDFVVNLPKYPKKLYQQIADKRRSNIYEELIEDNPIEDMTNLTHDLTPVLIEEIYVSEFVKEHNDFLPEVRYERVAPDLDYEELHLYILVHGYEASQIDVYELKNHIALTVPNSIFLCSQSNSNKESDDIDDMGFRLAEEIHDFMDDDYNDSYQISKITGDLWNVSQNIK